MRRSRILFRYALRQCQQHEDTLRADAMAQSQASHDCKTFWKEVKKSYNSKVPLSKNVNGQTCEHNIADMWRDHYKTLLNCVNTNSYEHNVNSLLKNSIGTNERTICNREEVAKALKQLKAGKSYGNDGLCAEHFIHSDKSLEVLLSILFTSILFTPTVTFLIV